MARVRLLRDLINGESYFLEPATGMSFRRTVGGICWPFANKAGCIVVLGETRSRQNYIGARRHDVHKLQEFASEDASAFVDRLAMLTDDWLIRNWAVPVCDKRVNLLDDMNYEQRKRKRRQIRYGDPLGWSSKGEGLLPFYHAFVQRRTLNEKTLFLGDSYCADECLTLGYAEREKSILEFPGVAALCFALAEIDMDSRQEERYDKNDWGPADELGGY